MDIKNVTILNYSNQMISCSIYGRLGNSLFQICTTIAHALRNNYNYMLPTHTCNEDTWLGYYRNFRNLKTGEIPNYLELYKEPVHCYNPIPKRDNLLLDGYFQSYKYFEDKAAEIKKILEVPNEIQEGYIGIHVRRGDYLQYPDKHPTLPMNYYIDAVRLIKFTADKEFKLLFFSDDIGFCQKAFQWDDTSFVTSFSPMADIFNLASCEHIITANSSFSWWAAFLNSNPDKIIVCPDHKQWFGPGNAHLDTSDLIPENWNQIPY